MLATLTDSGRAAIVRALKDRPIHLAWGAGQEEWDDENASLPSFVARTSLFNEIGRRAASFTGYVTPDENGDVSIPVVSEGIGVVTKRYKVVDEGPTPYLYIIVNYEYEDASNSVIRELGVFLDTKVSEDVPPGKRYYLPGELTDSGILLAAQIVSPSIRRSPSVRQSIEFVLPI